MTKTPHNRTRMWGFRPIANAYVNPILKHLAAWLPTFAVLTHHGRRSGRVYQTPVNVFRRDDEYLFFLTYGSDVQWVQNVLAAGGCTIETGGRTVELTAPRLVTDPDLRPAPFFVGLVERWLAGASEYVAMRAR